ncbi:MAG: hypothetical protein KDA22_07755 [Phycisphaerales bacterium]|nr:hypothetical protein [Phycisphaerales bacterium]
MRQTALLNCLLATNAVLLGGLLWTQVAEQPFAASAEAAPQSRPTSSRAPTDVVDTNMSGGVPNAGLQRLEILKELQRLRAVTEVQARALESLGKAIGSGKIKVEVSNIDDFASAVASVQRANAAGEPPVVRPAAPAGTAGATPPSSP